MKQSCFGSLSGQLQTPSSLKEVVHGLICYAYECFPGETWLFTYVDCNPSPWRHYTEISQDWDVACQGWYEAEQSVFYLNFLTIRGTWACIYEFEVVLWDWQVKKYIK